MAEPTLKDVLDAIARLEQRTDARFTAVDARLSTLGAELSALDAKVDAHRAETAKGFAELDAELARHADRTHRDLEQRVERLEKRAAPKKVTARAPRRR